MGRLTSTIGTTMVNDLEFAYSGNKINITAGGTDPGLLAATTAAIPPLWPLVVQDLTPWASRRSGVVSALMATARTCG